ncbi:MAG TPA: FAD-dependent oxidoreductase, partial [Anaerolineales bacterium]
MRRWNGWGDEATIYPLPDPAARYLEDLAGPGCPSPDAPLEAVLAQVPPAHLPAHPLVSSDPLERLLHARGQSLPDWIALRSGQVGLFPDGVAYPESDADVRSLLDYAGAVGARLIPYGGGTSVVGHINPLPGEAPVLTVDLSRLDQLLDLDETSRLATFGAGVPGPRLEAMLERLREMAQGITVLPEHGFQARTGHAGPKSRQPAGFIQVEKLVQATQVHRQ